MNTRPDTASALAGLKDFQRATVDHVFGRFYGEDPTKRFLVADEVGLGKTLVARGVIARTIDHLWNDVKRIDIIYVCSNADIARQNVQRLNIPGCNATTQSTRLTLLPTRIHDLEKHRVNFVALTPSTSFEQSGYGGRIDERALLYWLLYEPWEIGNSRKALNVLTEHAKVKSFERHIGWLNPATINESIAREFRETLAASIANDKAEGKADLRTRFEELMGDYCRSDIFPGNDAHNRRARWLGEMRRLLARVCLKALQPDLVIFDEFQRFSHLLHGESDSADLARELIDSEADFGARLLLLSATPYKSLAMHHEREGNPSSEFVSLVNFLENKPETDFHRLLEDYRTAIPAVRTTDGMAALRTAKTAIESRLRRIMARTEKSGSTSAGSAGMLAEPPPAGLRILPVDIKGFLGAQAIADYLEQGDVVEYWKSSPYLFNFMDSYALKKAFMKWASEQTLLGLVRDFPESFLALEQTHNYKPVDPANARLRALAEETVGQGMWRLLWLPPSLGYYEPSGPFADPSLAGVTKRLVFSAWHVVPKAIASMLSYEAERLMMRALSPKGSLTAEDWKKQKPLLRFARSAGRLTGLPLMGLVYPCLVFAKDCDPRNLAASGTWTAAEVLQQFEEKIRGMVDGLPLAEGTDGNDDERWYWVVPMLLDAVRYPAASRAWWKLDDLAGQWSESESNNEDSAWQAHVESAGEIIEAVRAGTLTLGPRPPDLLAVLAHLASAGPATVGLRALCRASGLALPANPPTRLAAGRIGGAFLGLFNHAEVTYLVRAEFKGGAYWRRVLEYAHAGQIQAVLDEYAHVLVESLGASSLPPGEVAEKLAAEMVETIGLRAASFRVDHIQAPPRARAVQISDTPMRVRFAMRFGDENDKDAPASADGTTPGARKEKVRAAFNSPFWPMVLVSTSVGQEGLDFHHYSHAISHWNLPANPVDLEQREGRIHRYKGHAIRKNVAAQHGQTALASKGGDPWKSAFAGAVAARTAAANDLVPFWHFPGPARIERHVPALPLSREVDRFDALRRALVLYRMVFGQNRQEDLIAYLLAEIPENEIPAVVEELKINLSPASVGRADCEAG